MNQNQFKNRDFTKQPITDEEIEWSYKKAARLVQNYGEQFLPIFERFQEEMEKASLKRRLKKLAEKVANDN